MARNFDGINDKILYGDSDSFSPFVASTNSMSVWQKNTMTGVQGEFFGKTASGAWEYQLEQIGSNVFRSEWLTVAGSQHLGITGATASNTGVWLNCSDVGTHGTKLEIFIDGSSEGSDTTAGADMGNTTTVLSVGARVDGGLAFAGDLAECALWDIALPTSHISALARGANPLFVSGIKPVFYSPVWGNESPELEYIGTTDGTLTDTTKSTSHPPVEMIENYL